MYCMYLHLVVLSKLTSKRHTEATWHSASKTGNWSTYSNLHIYFSELPSRIHTLVTLQKLIFTFLRYKVQQTVLLTFFIALVFGWLDLCLHKVSSCTDSLCYKTALLQFRDLQKLNSSWQLQINVCLCLCPWLTYWSTVTLATDLVHRHHSLLSLHTGSTSALYFQTKKSFESQSLLI